MLGRLMRLRALPWLMLFEVARATKGHWDTLDAADRRRLSELMRRTRGNPRNLTARDRDELRDIARRLDLKRLAATVGGAAVIGRRGRRRR